MALPVMLGARAVSRSAEPSKPISSKHLRVSFSLFSQAEELFALSLPLTYRKKEASNGAAARTDEHPHCWITFTLSLIGLDCFGVSGAGRPGHSVLMSSN